MTAPSNATYSMVNPGRRGCLRLASGLLIASLTGCGFELRRPSTMPFRTVQLSGFRPNSPLEIELRRDINATGSTLVVDSAAQAEVIFEALSDRREHSVVGSSAAGQVRNLNLRLLFKFRMRTAAGRELIPATELLLARDMSYTETAALAKEQDEEAIFRAMQSDIVMQVIRRLSASPAP